MISEENEETVEKLQVPAVTVQKMESDSDLSTRARETPTPASTLGKGRSSLSIDNEAAVTTFKASGRVLLAFGTLAIIILMVSLDGTIISVGLPSIARALHGSGVEAFWAGTSFLLASTVFQPTFASLSNIFGRIPLMITALTFFLAGAVVAALSNNFTLLLLGRTLQGIGGGGMQSLTEVVVTDLVPLRVRSKYFAIISASWSLGSVSGPIVGGAFTEDVSWRWMFYVNLPFIGIALVVVPLTLRLKSLPASIATKLHRVDFLGMVLFTASMTSFLIPVTWAGVQYAWLSWHTLVPLFVGLGGLVLFLLYEAYLAPEPLVPLSIFRNRTSCIAYLAETAQGICMWCILYYLPLYFEASKSYSPVSAGLGILPLTVTLAPAAVIMGLVIARTGKYYLANLIGWAIGATGLGLMTLMDPSIATWKWVVFMVFAGIGQGILVQSLRLTIQAASNNKNVASAAALYVFFRCLGQTLGVAIGGVTFQNEVKERLKSFPEFQNRALDLAKDAAALVETIKQMPDGPKRHDLQVVYADAFRVVCVVLTAICIAMMIACIFIKSYDLNRALETDQGFNYDARPLSTILEEGTEKRFSRLTVKSRASSRSAYARASSPTSTLTSFTDNDPRFPQSLDAALHQIQIDSTTSRPLSSASTAVSTRTRNRLTKPPSRNNLRPKSPGRRSIATGSPALPSRDIGDGQALRLPAFAPLEISIPDHASRTSTPRPCTSPDSAPHTPHPQSFSRPWSVTSPTGGTVPPPIPSTNIAAVVGDVAPRPSTAGSTGRESSSTAATFHTANGLARSASNASTAPTIRPHQSLNSDPNSNAHRKSRGTNPPTAINTFSHLVHKSQPKPPRKRPRCGSITWRKLHEKKAIE
ncbi:MAG: hypothetical protein Q9227_004236 [Pyrenula ochraceoflavens]